MAASHLGAPHAPLGATVSATGSYCCALSASLRGQAASTPLHQPADPLQRSQSHGDGSASAACGIGRTAGRMQCLGVHGLRVGRLACQRLGLTILRGASSTRWPGWSLDSRSAALAVHFQLKWVGAVAVHRRVCQAARLAATRRAARRQPLTAPVRYPAQEMPCPFVSAATRSMCWPRDPKLGCARFSRDA